MLAPATYSGRNLMERIFYWLKEFRHIATRYDKRADIFLSAVCIVAAITRQAN
jgi:transposase